MTRYDDCESCAFHETETVICDDCEDADQWEPAEPMDAAPQQQVVQFYDRHSRTWKKAA